MRLVDKLKHRFQIKIASLDVSDDRVGGLDREYTTLISVWGELIPISQSGYSSMIAAIRGVNETDLITHLVRLRWAAVKYLGKSYTNGFDIGYKGMADLQPIKKNYFLFKQEGSTLKGRLFRIHGVMRDDEHRDEYIKLRVQEVEEQGTGYGTESY